ncbi:complement decay-accelerating factor isoform X2 [Octodon degus]|uniref:Complement decay-accelerating factor isoform X2 n=1 Tax=Octodon degus TaxID=10160 RepID=A0A6P6DBA7_OCTDE|nr:complement decay-accelerating factor isoform X2 [Octodon degus]
MESEKSAWYTRTGAKAVTPAEPGDCGLPPVIPHAQAELGGNTNFPENSSVLYKCEKDFYKIPGMADAVICLPNNKWTDIKEFCNRSCEVPPRLTYAALKKIYISMNYFPVGTVIEYECRPGYRKKPGLPTKVTCLDNVTWSTPETFCDKRSCLHPGEILNGRVDIKTDLLFGSQIFFTCETGYRLVGAASAFCLLSGSGVDWNEQLPICTKILCPDPPTITNGWITNERHIYEYRQVVTYECKRGFILTGDKHISCTVKGDIGAWSGSAPKCRDKSSIPLTSSPRPSTTNMPGIEVSLPPQKHTTINVPGTEVPSTSQKSTTVNDPASKHGPDSGTSTSSPTTEPEEKGLTSGYKAVLYGVVPGVIIIGSLILAKFLWDRGKSGMKNTRTKKIYYKTRENNKESNVLFHNLNEADAAPEIRLPSDKL